MPDRFDVQLLEDPYYPSISACCPPIDASSDSAVTNEYIGITLYDDSYPGELLQLEPLKAIEAGLSPSQIYIPSSNGHFDAVFAFECPLVLDDGHKLWHYFVRVPLKPSSLYNYSFCGIVRGNRWYLVVEMGCFSEGPPPVEEWKDIAKSIRVNPGYRGVNL